MSLAVSEDNKKSLVHAYREQQSQLPFFTLPFLYNLISIRLTKTKQLNIFFMNDF